MSDPLKIMDEIERRGLTHDGGAFMSGSEIQSLRTALKHQSAELEAERAAFRALAITVEARAEELAQANARIVRLQDALNYIAGAYAGKGRLQEVAVEALNESHAQSADALKAEALREAADDWEPQPCPLNRPAIRERLREMADELERAKREGGE